MKGEIPCAKEAESVGVAVREEVFAVRAVVFRPIGVNQEEPSAVLDSLAFQIEEQRVVAVDERQIQKS